MTAVLADTSVWMRRQQPRVARVLARAVASDRALMTTPIALELLRAEPDLRTLRVRAGQIDLLHWIPTTAIIERRARDVLRVLARRGYHRGPSPVDLLAAAAAESVGAELWHCDRHFALIGEITGQPMRRVGE